MKYWKIKVFISDRGINVIKEWLDGLPLGAQAAINARFRYLETAQTWVRPYSAKRKGTEHIYEIRIKWKKNQYRPLGFYGPGKGDFSLLIGAQEKDGKLEPKDSDKIADQRRKLILQNGHNLDDFFK